MLSSFFPVIKPPITIFYDRIHHVTTTFEGTSFTETIDAYAYGIKRIKRSITAG